MKSNQIKVSKKIKPLPNKERTIPELIIGGDYFVSFGSNKVRACKILEILDNGKRVVIDHTPPLIFKCPLIGKKARYIIDSNVLNSDEIGLTPIQAVQNKVG